MANESSTEMTQQTNEETEVVKKKKPKKSKKPDVLPPGPVTGALELVTLRNNFYRDNFRRLMIVCLFLIGIIAALCYYINLLEKNKPKPVYFATTSDGKLIELIALSRPFLDDNALLQWATKSATDAYTLNFVNYRKALQDIRPVFTRTGYQKFLKALKDSRNLEAVKAKKFVVTAEQTAVPKITRKGVTSNGRYYWIVEFPMKLTFQNEKEKLVQNNIARLVITRIPNLLSKEAVGIESFVLLVQEDR